MQNLIHLIVAYKYFIIFPLAVIEGPFLSVLLGYLIFVKYVNVVTTFLVLLAADILPDIFYWRLGRYGNKKIVESTYFSNPDNKILNIKALEHLWHTHTVKTMFFGKLSYGISLPIIISAGVAKLPLKRFIAISIPVGIFQIGVLLLIGYLLGNSYEAALSYIKYTEMAVAALVVIVVTLYIVLIKYSVKTFKE